MAYIYVMCSTWRVRLSLMLMPLLLSVENLWAVWTLCDKLPLMEFENMLLSVLKGVKTHTRTQRTLVPVVKLIFTVIWK